MNQLELISIQLNSVSIQFMNSVQQLIKNSIKVKWDANWCKRYWKFACEHGVGKEMLKRHSFEKTEFHA